MLRKSLWPCLALILGSTVGVGESSACRFRAHAGRRQCRCAAVRPAVGNVPVVYASPAPMASPVAAPAWHATPQAAAPLGATPGAPARAFVFKGKTYQAIPTNERGESEERELRELTPSFSRSRPSDGEHFAGSARKAAKTSFAVAPVENFASPGAVLDSILQGASPVDNDAATRPRLNANSPRSQVEQRNVTVTTFLYATKKESDNDFHLLIGGDPNGGDGRFMTAEVSGLPNPDDALTPQFQNVRDEYRSFFQSSGQDLPGDRYVRFSPPVPVTLTGSIFFDVDHRIGEVHSGDIVPETVWEIHPVSDLVFGPGDGS